MSLSQYQKNNGYRSLLRGRYFFVLILILFLALQLFGIPLFFQNEKQNENDAEHLPTPTTPSHPPSSSLALEFAPA
jgi:hypothetical protein